MVRKSVMLVMASTLFALGLVACSSTSESGVSESSTKGASTETTEELNDTEACTLFVEAGTAAVDEVDPEDPQSLIDGKIMFMKAIKEAGEKAASLSFESRPNKPTS